MKVVLIHEAFVTPAEGGGTRHYELARNLEGKGFTFTVITSTNTYMGQKAAGANHEVHGNVEIRRVGAPPRKGGGFFNRIRGYFAFAAAARREALTIKDASLVWATSPPLPQAWIATKVAKVLRIPLLVEIRDLWPEFPIAMGALRNPVLIRLARAMERSVYLSADHIIINSPGFSEHLRNSGVMENQISLVPNGVDTDAIKPDSGREVERDALGMDDKFVVLYAGALGPANDLWTALKAAERLRHRDDIRFAFVGDGVERGALEARAKELRLMNVSFYGAVPKQRMPSILAASDVCLAILKSTPVFRTVYPNKVFDYMAAGKPTILAIDGVIRDVITKAHGGTYCEPGDADAIARAVETYADKPTKARNEGKAARHHVVSRFSRKAQTMLLERALVHTAATNSDRRWES